MHTVTIVLLPRDTSDFWRAGSDLLRQHVISEDDVSEPRRLDYWTVGDESISDEESARLLGVADNPELARNVCLVSRLRPDFVPGAVVTQDGRWHDLEDHGWKFMQGNSLLNRSATNAWAAQVGQLFSAHASCVAVEFNTHC